MADSPIMSNVKPLALSEKEMQTRALPDQTPGDVSDADTNVINDANLQSTTDYEAIASALDSGELDQQIAQEEANLQAQEQQTGQATPSTDTPDPNLARPDERLPADLATDDDNGSAPPDIGVYGDVEANPVTGALPPTRKDPEIKLPTTPAPQETPPKEEPAAETEPAKNPSYRLKGNNDVESLAFELRKKADIAGRDLSMKDAIRLAEDTYGVQDTSSKGIEETIADDPALEGVPHDPEAIRLRLREIDSENIAAGEEMEFDKQRELMAEKHKLEDALPALKNYQEQAESAYMDGFTASQSKVLELYPMAKDANGALATMIGEMDAGLEDSGDERFYSPEKPMLLAREAAKRLGIFPQTKAPTPAALPAATTPSAPSEAAPRAKYQAAPPVPASGNAGSQGGSIASREPDYENLSMDGYESLKEGFQN